MVAAQDSEPPVIIADPPAGVTLDLFAWGEFTAAIPAGTALVLDRVGLRGCGLVPAPDAVGPVLLFVESSSVTVNWVIDGNLASRSLAQGESTLLDPGPTPTFAYELMNGMIDAAYHVSVLLLHFAPVGEPPTATAGAPLGSWPEGSPCADRPDIGRPPTVERLAEGVDGEGATVLYLGAGTWRGCATLPTIPSGPASAINVLVLTGGMVGGMSSGRGTLEGPGDLLRDAYAEQIGHHPLTNRGPMPAYALIFGTAAAGQPVLVPNPDADRVPPPC
jgi:hypothetical protein